jgi:hypothetical protein
MRDSKASSRGILDFGRLLLAGAVLVILMGWVPAHADSIIYSNLGSGGTVYNETIGYSVSAFVTSAMAFTPSANYDLAQIDLALGNSEGTNSAIVTILTDSSDAPGTVLDTWNLTGLPAFSTTSTILQTLTPGSSTTPSAVIALNSGVQYWIEAVASPLDTLDGWNWNSTGATGPKWQMVSGTITATNGAFDVLGNSVTVTTPEPSTWLLLGIGLLVLLALAARRNSLPRLHRA